MKQKNRLLAFLTALCLLASLAVVPAAAASLSELESAVNAAQAELSNAQTELSGARQELESAKSIVAEAERAADEAESAVSQKQAALDTLKQQQGTEEAPDDLDQQISTAESELEAAKSEALNKKSEYDAAKSQAGLDEKQSAFDAAEAAVAEKQKKLDDAKAALEEEKKNQAAQNPPAVPTSSDLSYSSTVDFGKVAKGSTSDLTRTFTITNRSSYDMILRSDSVNGYTITGASGALSAGNSATVTVRLDSAKSTGTYNRSLKIDAYFKDGVTPYTMSISIYAEVVETNYTISLNPTSKDFGKLAEGYEEKTATDAAVTVTVENKGASSVQMNGVKGNDHFTVSAVGNEYTTLKNGEKTDYKIAPKKGLAVGTYTDTITFQTREGTTASFKATVVVEKKLDPLTVSPTALSFGTVEEGYTALATQTVTIKNNSDRTILLTQPTSYSYEISMLPQAALASGASISFTIRPRTGLPANSYTGDIYISGNGEQAKLNVQFLVTRPAGPTTFSDVPSNSTFASDIAYVSQKGLMSGVGGGNFKPQAPITRGQLVTILYRLEGQPAVSGVGFSDVAAGSYCEKAVKWAAATAITTGGNDGLFRPNDPITREQLATFLYRYNRHKGYFTFSLADLSTFPDVAQVSSYAKDALSWANGAKLVNGTSDGRLNPSGGATRGQAAAILHRYCVSIGQ